MPVAATVADAQDRFTDVFGNKRGANRPECDIIAVPDSSSLGVPCGGGCGARVIPSIPIVAGGDVGTWYCSQCSEEEGKRRTKEMALAQQRARTTPMTSEERYLASLTHWRHVRWRFSKCFFSRPFGHAWVPDEDPEEWESPPHCANCRKMRRKHL